MNHDLCIRYPSTSEQSKTSLDQASVTVYDLSSAGPRPINMRRTHAGSMEGV
jgi:hypothetical protein